VENLFPSEKSGAVFVNWLPPQVTNSKNFQMMMLEEASW
jgi:hypothetical protein